MINRLIKSLDLSNHPSRKRATILQAVGGYVNTGIIIVQGLLLIPLYLHYIGAHMYGLWLASGGMLGMLGLVNFGISGLVIQRISKAYAQSNLSQAGAYFINGVIIYLGICLLYAAAGWVASIWLPEILKVTGENSELLRECFQIAVLAMVIGIFNELLRSFAHALLRPVVSLVSIAAGRILAIGVTAWMLVNDFGLWSIPVGILISEGLIFIINLIYAFKLFQRLGAVTRLERGIIMDFMQTSPVLLMARVGDTASREADPLLITMLLGPEITTAYMVTRRAADIVFRLLSVSTASTMSPFSHLAGCGDHYRTARVAAKLLTLIFSIGVISFSTYVGANDAFVSLWVGESFALDQNITFFIALGFLARTFRGLLGQMLHGLGDFAYPSIVILLEGIVRIVLTVWLLNILDVIGVPLAFTLSCLISIVPLGFRLKKRLEMNICFPAVARLLFTGAVLYGTSISLLQAGFDINSWGRFALYLGTLVTGASTMYILMNWARFREVYKSVLS